MDTFKDHAGQSIPFRVRATRAGELPENAPPRQWLTCEINPHGDAWQVMARGDSTGSVLRRSIETWNEFDANRG